MLLAKFHYLFLAPLITLGTPVNPFLGGIFLPVVVVLIGLSGTMLGERRLLLIASSILLFLLISGKVESDLFKVGSPDTAVLLVEFGMILFLMEAALVAVDFDKARMELALKDDEISQTLEARLGIWLRTLLSRQGKIGIGSIGLSLLLIPLAGFTSVSSGQLPVTGALVLIAILALLFLVIHRREPERESKR